MGIAKSMGSLLDTVTFGGFGKLIELMTGGMTMDRDWETKEIFS